MKLVVLKFGGTSVASTKKIKEVVKIIKQELSKNSKVIVVISAMAGITNSLISLCSEISSLNSRDNLAEYDSILATGEMVSSALLSLAMQSEDIAARSVFAWQLPIFTSDDYTKAIVNNIGHDNNIIDECLKNNIVPVIAGFQGVTKKGRLTTLGRGGSDTTALLIAAKFCADRCDIYTDVDGIFSADPRLVKKAIRLDIVSFEEMLELASCGAKVLATRSVEIAMRYNIPVRVLSTFLTTSLLNSLKKDNISLFNHGSLITSKDKIMENKSISAITSNQNISLVKVKNDNIDFIQFVTQLTQENIHFQFMIQAENEYQFLVPLNEKIRLETILKNKNFDFDDDIAIISIIGYGIKNDLDLKNDILKIIEKIGSILLMIEIVEIRISLMVRQHNHQKLLVSLHDKLVLSK